MRWLRESRTEAVRYEATVTLPATGWHENPLPLLLALAHTVPHFYHFLGLRAQIKLYLPLCCRIRWNDWTSSRITSTVFVCVRCLNCSRIFSTVCTIGYNNYARIFLTILCVRTILYNCFYRLVRLNNIIPNSNDCWFNDL